MRTLDMVVHGFGRARVMVWGDVCVDRFILADAVRVSREAPVPVLEHRGSWQVPGCAGNAVANVAALGAKASFAGLTGDDGAGRWFASWCREKGIAVKGLVRAKGCNTPRKNRVLAGAPHAARHQILRLDEGDLGAAPDGWWRAAGIAEALRKQDGLLLSDYGYGSVAPEAWSRVRKGAPNVVVLDSRSSAAAFAGVTAVTPNWAEAEALLGDTIPAAGLDRAGKALRAKLKVPLVLLKRGPGGLSLFGDGAPFHVPAFGVEAVDVTGAGDSVAAAFTVALAAGAPARDAAVLANMAGGLKVAKQGTVPVTGAELLAAAQAGEAGT